MSGSPSEAELQTILQNSVDVLETMRAHVDGTHAGASGKWDTLEQSLEGDYTPADIGAAVARYRSVCSTLLDPGTALDFLAPIVREYAQIIETDAGGAGTFGSGYTDLGELFTAIYEWFVDNSLTVQSRNITYDTSATAGGSNVGNGAFTRLTRDANDFAIEACHVERKIFRCRADQNSGTEEDAEVFEFLGAQSTFDSILRGSFGSGTTSRTNLRVKNAGSGAGGSLLSNSSFSTFDASATPKFTGWAQTLGGAAAAGDITQDTTNYYRTHPGASTDASLKLAMDNAGDTITLKQTIDDMRVSRLDPDTPYFFRVMLNKTVGTAVGGTVTIRCGSKTAAITIASLGSNWQELRLGDESLAGSEDETDQWLRNFNQDPFDIEIEWTGGTSGYLLVDDAIFCPYDLVDGTWWALRGNAGTHTPFLVDDTLTFTDTGGAPSTGKIQWWLFVAGLGYLPSTTGTPTLTDP